MSKIYLHIKNDPSAMWENKISDFIRLPCVGEYIATSSHSKWYEVKLVVHCPFNSEYDAEVFALGEEINNVIKNSIKYREHADFQLSDRC